MHGLRRGSVMVICLVTNCKPLSFNFLLYHGWRLNESWLRGRYPRQSWVESAYIPVVISTSSIALQNAIIKDYLPELSQILLRHGVISSPLTAAIRKETLGLDLVSPHKLFETTMPSPFDYDKNALLYISENTPFPDNKDKNYITSIADEIERLVLAAHGHAAVLFTSYNAMG